MVDFPSTQNTGNLIDFLGKISEVGVPQKLTGKGMSQYGYTSSNDRSIVTILKFIGFLTDAGEPTELWKESRTDSKKTVAAGIVSGYQRLYQTYPNAHQKDVEALTNFFKSRTDVGDTQVKRITNTFRSLVEYADFSDQSDRVQPANDSKNDERPKVQPPEQPNSAQVMEVNLNVQLTLPADESGKVYDAFFKSMRKHLYGRNDD